MKKCMILLLLLLTICLLSACKGNALPDEMNEEELLSAGIKPNTIRLSIGTEHIDDIIADLEKGFNAVK